jgi:hypothetical protein
MKRHLVRRVWLGLLFAGTFGAILWVGYIASIWELVIADINPDSMPPLNDAQAGFLIDHTRAFMLLSAVPPLLMAFLWGTTVAVLHMRGQLPPVPDTARSDAVRPNSLT